MLETVHRVAALTVTAISLGMSAAHVLEAPPRLRVWPPELWRETTVFHGQYALFGALGGPIEMTMIALAIAAAVAAARTGEGAPAAITAAVLLSLSLVAWLAIVAPANSVMATWRPGPLPPEFAAVQRRWETGHMIIAGLKLIGFLALALWAVRPAAGAGLGR